MNILIVGGGVAGLGAALFLAADGYQVTVAERQTGPIDKVCGEGIIPFGVGLLSELGLAEEVAAAGKPFGGVCYACGPYRAEGTFAPGVHGIGIGRSVLDALLRRRAKSLGVQILGGTQITPGEAKDFDRVLAADGINSQWAASVGHATIKNKRLGLRFRLAVAPPEKVSVHFLKGMEIYLTPVAADQLSVAFLLDPAPLKIKGAMLREYCQSIFRERFPEYAQLQPEEVAMRGPISATLKAGTPKLHLLGDAAVAFDPISGAGMSFALLCAKLAAKHLHSPQDYWQALQVHRRAINAFTNTVLFFRGGGMLSHLMVRQLSKAPKSFDRILALHNGCSAIWDLGVFNAVALLKP